jgi:site-specific recombinase XerD
MIQHKYQHEQVSKFSLSIESLIEKFLYYLEYEKNNSPKTLENYSLWLNRFVNYIWDINVTDIKAMHVLDYRMYLNGLGLWKKTINYHIVAIRSFFKFCLKNDIDCMSPEKLELSKIPNREINYLLEDEVQKIMEAPLNSEKLKVKSEKDTLKIKRDVAILWMLYGTWLRVSELVSIKRSQINSDSKQFSVVWKWSKIRAIFMTSKAREALVEYLKARTDDSDYLFISLSGNSFGSALSRNSIEDIVRKYKDLAWIKKKVTPHTLRHSFATTLLKKWADIRAVQTLLGHSSITTTQIYTHVDDKYLKEVHDLLDG